MEELNSNYMIVKNEELSEKRNEKKSLITFAKFNKLFCIPLLFALFYFLSDLFETLFDGTNIIVEKEFIKSILYDLPNVIAGLFHYVSYFRENVDKKKKEKDDEEKDKEERNSGIIYYIYNESLPPIYDNKPIIILIILLCLMSALDDLLWAVTSNSENVFDERLFYLFFIPLFSKIILKQDIYKHQYFSFLIAFIGMIFLYIPNILKFDTGKDIVPNIINFIKSKNFPLFLVIVKYLVEKYYISPLKICLLIGVTSIIINVIGYSIYCLIINDFKLFTNCIDFSQDENKLESIFYLIFYLVFVIASQFTLYLSIYYFYPTLIMITGIICPIFLSFVEFFTENIEIKFIILDSIGYIIALFSSLIYNELIIFNCCGLNRNTKKFIHIRINKELEEIKQSEDILMYDIYDDSIMGNKD